MYVAPDFRAFLNCKMTLWKGPQSDEYFLRIRSAVRVIVSRYRQPAHKPKPTVGLSDFSSTRLPCGLGASVIGRRVTVRGRGQWEAPGLGFTGGSRSLRRASDWPLAEVTPNPG